MNDKAFVRAALRLYVVAALCLTAAAPASALDIQSFSVAVTKRDGSIETQAAAHPQNLTISLAFPTKVDDGGVVAPAENLKDLRIDLPRGVIGDPSVAASCAEEQLEQGGVACPTDSQVGVVEILQAVGGFFGTAAVTTPLFNMTPRPGAPAEFGFNPGVGGAVLSRASVRTGDDYGISFALRDLPQMTAVVSTTITLWGTPADPSHDVDRGAYCFVYPGFGQFCPQPGGASSKLLPRPFLTLPSDCGAGPMASRVTLDSWQSPHEPQTASSTSQLPDGTPVGVDGCGRLSFGASVKARPAEPRAAAPAPYVIDLDVSQDDNPVGLATPPLKKAVVTLPDGTAINPSAADGLAACSPAQIALDSPADETCPDASRIGDVTVTTPLLPDPMKGSVYLAKPHDNPTSSLMALYLAVKGSGVLLKLPGRIDLDPKTGRVTATFDDNPQLPFSNLHMTFRGGDRAPLVNPSACGVHTTTAELTSWGGQTTESTSTFVISGDGRGGPCAAHRFQPGLEAGATNAVAGASSPFTFRLTRDDADAEFSSVHTTLPLGMLANVKDIALCGDAQAAAGTCGDDALIGHVDVASGAGASPFLLHGGRVYFTGPYRGAPFGLSIVVPVVAGPFDLGTVIVRAAVSVDPATAAVTVDTDPLPAMLEGIPLKIRDLRLTIDRAGFMINPTNCTPQTLTATVGSTAGDSVTVGNRFQVADCASLPLHPRLTMELTGPRSATRAGGNPTLVAHLTQDAAEADLRKAVVELPKVLGFDIHNTKEVCKVAQARAGQCPQGSLIGHASVRSVLHEPLTGPVYFMESSKVDPTTGKAITGLPGLFLPLSAEGVTLDITASTEVAGGRLVETFDHIPDAPIAAFDLTIDGGKGSILVLGDDLCRVTPTTVVQADGQNGKIADGTVVASTPCSLRLIRRGVTGRRLTLRVGGLGRGNLTVEGAMVHRASRALTRTSVATVRTALSLRAQRLWRRHRLRRLSVRVTFRPPDGAPAQSRVYHLRVKEPRNS